MIFFVSHTKNNKEEIKNSLGVRVRDVRVCEKEVQAMRCKSLMNYIFMISCLFKKIKNR